MRGSISRATAMGIGRMRPHPPQGRKLIVSHKSRRRKRFKARARAIRRGPRGGIFNGLVPCLSLSPKGKPKIVRVDAPAEPDSERP
jgi:hypothetical protein